MSTVTALPGAETPTTVAVAVDELRALLRDSVPAAATELGDPEMIASVLLHTAVHEGRPVLVATATNRFILSQAHAPLCSPVEIEPVQLPATAVRALLGVLGDDPDADDPLSGDSDDAWLRVGETSCTLERRAALPERGTCTVTVDRFRSVDFPPYRKLFADHEHVPGPIGLAPNLMRLFAGIAEARGELLSIAPTQPGRAVHVQIGQRYRALWMPMRLPDERTGIPLFDAGTD